MYQAGTSEMFGNSIDEDGFQRETTPFKPANPYAVAKQFAHQMCVNYRNAYNLFISNGILFNHESPRRGDNFVTSKVVREAVKIKLNLASKLELGTLSSSRDWGHARDYVKAMWIILQHNTPGDYVCSTVNPTYSRPEETKHLKGDSTKLRTEIGWEPEYTFESLLDEMIQYNLLKYQK